LVNQLSDVFEDPQILAREMVVEMQHPLHGAIRAVGNPVRFDDWSTGTKVNPAPMLGQHTHEILADVLDLTKEAIEELVERGVIQGPRPEPVDAADAVTPA
jgi:CoA:oxalate CoA-transferase